MAWLHQTALIGKHFTSWARSRARFREDSARTWVSTVSGLSIQSRGYLIVGLTLGNKRQNFAFPLREGSQRGRSVVTPAGLRREAFDNRPGGRG